MAEPRIGPRTNLHPPSASGGNMYLQRSHRTSGVGAGRYCASFFESPQIRIAVRPPSRPSYSGHWVAARRVDRNRQPGGRRFNGRKCALWRLRAGDDPPRGQGLAKRPGWRKCADRRRVPGCGSTARLGPSSTRIFGPVPDASGARHRSRVRPISSRLRTSNAKPWPTPAAGSRQGRPRRRSPSTGSASRRRASRCSRPRWRDRSSRR